MALSIKDFETDQLVRRYAKLKGTSYTGAIKLAVSEAIDREQSAEAESFKERVLRISAEVAKLPRSGLTEDEIMGWDENGLPT